MYIIHIDGVYRLWEHGSADLILTGNYNVPLYAQWKYGEGTVGSFMCDLSGVWSSELLASEEGIIVIQNIVSTLSPIKNIRTNDIKLTLKEDNYYNNLSILTDLKEGEYIKGTVYYVKDGKIESEAKLVVEENEAIQTNEDALIVEDGDNNDLS